MVVYRTDQKSCSSQTWALLEGSKNVKSAEKERKIMNDYDWFKKIKKLINELCIITPETCIMKINRINFNFMLTLSMFLKNKLYCHLIHLRRQIKSRLKNMWGGQDFLRIRSVTQLTAVLNQCPVAWVSVDGKGHGEDTQGLCFCCIKTAL